MDGDIKFGRIGWVAVGVGRGMAKGAVRGASHRRIGSSSETGVWWWWRKQHHHNLRIYLPIDTSIYLFIYLYCLSLYYLPVPPTPPPFCCFLLFANNNVNTPKHMNFASVDNFVCRK